MASSSSCHISPSEVRFNASPTAPIIISWTNDHTSYRVPTPLQNVDSNSSSPILIGSSGTTGPTGQIGSFRTTGSTGQIWSTQSSGPIFKNSGPISTWQTGSELHSAPIIEKIGQKLTNRLVGNWR